jgi:hypothetical protein
MEPQLVTSINHPPMTRLGSPMLADASERVTTGPAAPELAQDLRTEDLDMASHDGALWSAQPSEHEKAQENPGLEMDHASTIEVASSAHDSATAQAVSHDLHVPVPINNNEQAAAPEPKPSSQRSPRQRSPTASTSPSSSVGMDMRARMRSKLLLDDGSEEEEEEDAPKKTMKKSLVKKTGSVAVGKYKIAVDSDGDDSSAEQDILIVGEDDDANELESILRRNRPLSATQALVHEQAQEVAAAHAEDIWKPINIWSHAKPASTVRSQTESAVMLSSWDLQLLHTVASSPQLKRSTTQIHPPAEAPAASRMTQLPPDRGRKWPLNNLFAIKAQRSALSGVQLSAEDAAHLQDIENCIAEGGQIADELQDVRAKLKRLQQQPVFTRASTQLKSSHTVAAAELRTMTGDSPQKNPFLPADYRCARASRTAEGAAPYDCIRLLQSYDTAAGTAQRLQEHDRMMSDLFVPRHCHRDSSTC